MHWPFSHKPSASDAGRQLSELSHLSQRERIKARARIMAADMGRPIPPALESSIDRIIREGRADAARRGMGR